MHSVDSMAPYTAVRVQIVHLFFWHMLQLKYSASMDCSSLRPGCVLLSVPVTTVCQTMIKEEIKRLISKIEIPVFVF